MNRRRYIARFVCLMMFLILIIWYGLHRSAWITRSLHKPVILIWNPFFGDYSFFMPDLEKIGCNVSRCILTNNRSEAKSADAVLYHWVDVNLEEVPRSKPKRQKWILVNYEPALKISKEVLTELGPWVDWTVSYRTDSDFFSPYGRIRPVRPSDPPYRLLSPEEFSKKLPVAWMASFCGSNSGREELVKQLLNDIDVRVYGGCAALFGQPAENWPTEQREQLYVNLGKRFKFYLAMENTFCDDYVTEKVYYSLQHGMVPVVLGSADYEKIFPAGSFINIKSFSSPRLLAQYLSEVSNNYTRYIQYLEWRKHAIVEHSDVRNYFMCDICERLASGNSEDADKSGKRDVVDWWTTENYCHKS